MSMEPRAQACRRSAAALLISVLLLSTAVEAAPAIRTDGGNKVPACVSPERLMAFLRDRNEDLDPRYADIARWYKHYGDAWRVRWDYAFYQMVLETNYLKYRRGDGRRGDVHEKQNNFAGIGATGGGVAGERFTDIKTGVHAQIQHLVAYSGERVADPVAKRTDENQDDIIAKSKRLGRPVTFGDLARRWAADRQYAKNIDFVAEQFRDGYCKGPTVAEDVPRPQPARRFAKPAGLGGPKPQMLAGPETLPWQDAGGSVAQAVEPDAKTTPAKAPAAPEPSKSGPPVRTLWSREKGSAPADEAGQTPERNAVPAPSQQRAETQDKPTTQTMAPVSEQARPAGSMPAESAAPSAQPENDTVELPTFRIAPRTPEPSRLGGPVSGDLPAAASVPGQRMPAGTFVEMDPPPFTKPAGASAREARVLPPASAKHLTSQDGAAGDCRILTASYGGKKTLLVQSENAGVLQLTALTVLEGFENSMVQSYAKASAPGAKIIASYNSKADALAEAKAICPGG